MQNDIKQRISESKRAFLNLVWPVISTWLGGGELVPMEGIDAEFARKLDIYSGIDAWQFVGDHVRGLASRVQVRPTEYEDNRYPYNTFTIRHERRSGVKTEYQKRQEAVNSGEYIFPDIMAQAYLEMWYGPLLTVATAKTKDILDCIAKGHADYKWTHEGDSRFVYCSWADMRQNDYHIKIYP